MRACVRAVKSTGERLHKGRINYKTVINQRKRKKASNRVCVRLDYRHHVHLTTNVSGCSAPPLFFLLFSNFLGEWGGGGYFLCVLVKAKIAGSIIYLQHASLSSHKEGGNEAGAQSIHLGNLFIRPIRREPALWLKARGGGEAGSYVIPGRQAPVWMHTGGMYCMYTS